MVELSAFALLKDVVLRLSQLKSLLERGAAEFHWPKLHAPPMDF